MTLSREEMKKEAIRIMHTLNIYEPYIEEFAKNDVIYCFESFISEKASEELQKKAKEIEALKGCLVYAIIANGEAVYSFLTISKYEEDKKYTLISYPPIGFKVYSYVWNVAIEHYSEFGMIVVQCFQGGLNRIY